MKKLMLFGLLTLLWSFSFGQNGSYPGILKINALESSPAFFYINTNIPATDNPAPQLHITGYMYGNSNKALDITIGWYHYQSSFYWTQYHSQLGYAKPARIRLGKYINSNGVTCIRVELSNGGVYWSNYTISATDQKDFPAYYSGWSFALGEMPSESTTEIREVPQQSNITIQGKLSIGTDTPPPADYKLAVAGKIIAEELNIKLRSNWPDYVFEEGYKVGTLEALESYIKANKHLPEMPAARDIEENGLVLGEVVKLQQKKIEELTLHLIEKDKEIGKLKKMEAKVNELDQKLNLLLQQLNKTH
ncbi:hypothetical protein DBR40_01030 [Pedobacter sp. KBW01]|uniref:hypothetical protein n=1 Tax=Pedobacter sp. KBW01 TaxID=2153364 RepID=UPI000F5AF52A|nr:hypothetical protein [Pedobacter sp. KBW01]RQO80232.1 hypothetical protein DBR40_01030 [Pedobacter sp. KBW01]